MSSHKILRLLFSLLLGLVPASLSAEQPGVAGEDFWTATSTTDAPGARYNHTAVWAGSKMIVWGGNLFHRVTNTGGQYDPVTDSWTATATAGAPTARSGHTAVWTGTKMIVWGGSDGALFFPPTGGQFYTNTGAQYDPVTDSWTAIPTVGAPAARAGHTAIWTGTKMIVWGGFDGTSTLNTGAQYDPVTDSWTPIASAGAPTPRGGHTAVWTGSKMIIWGGGASVYFLTNTGAQYDPLTDSWTAIATAAAPIATFSHAAVWTGTKMIVWGGAVGDSFGTGPPPTTNTGGQYDPASNTWTATTTLGAPASRWRHTAVWTGSKIVVWGGDGRTTGGQYDPLTDFWTPTTITGAPALYLGHTAVWTGRKMIVWGGGTTGAQWSPSAGLCTSAPDTLCLNGNRFAVQVRWRVPSQGTSGSGMAMPMTGDTGSFWFFNPSNIELVVKVLDGRAVNGRFWVFYGALSNVEYTITVTDTVTGAVRTYSNPSGTQASVADTTAF